MAPSFLSSLRRRSRASFRTDRSFSSNGSDLKVPATKSSSTLNSAYGSQTPPSVLTSSDSSTNIQQHQGGAPSQTPPTRPQILTSNSKRYSVGGMAGLGSPSTNGSPSLPMSPYAPRVTSIMDNTIVFQKTLLIYGTIGDATTQSVEGTLNIVRQDDAFPPTQWPVSESYFKALILLTPGLNKIRLDFTSPKLVNSGSSNNIHASYINIHMMPMNNSPPLQLVILLGSDSPGTFDAVPARIEKEGNGLETAIRKYRMAAYLWQAFTAEQMHRNKLGRRCFRFEEEWQSGTSNLRDRENNTMRNEAKIHVIRCDKTVKEIRDLDLAQQNPNAGRKGDLFAIASKAVKQHFNILPGQKQYVSVLYLDAHWNKESKLITGHAALGGGDNELGLAIFGSQALQSYPSSIEEVVPAFTDCTRTNTDYVANDCNESGSNWEAANIGIGAHLHEVGHLFGCPHQESGIMLRDYVKFNRTFTVREPFSTRTNEKGGLVSQKSECTWHRLDCLRFRQHPCFRLAGDIPLSADDSIRVWPVDGGVIVTAPSGVAHTEIYTEGDDLCHTWIEHGDNNGHGPIQRQLFISEQEIRGLLPEDRRKSKLRISAKSSGGGSADTSETSATKITTLKLPNGQVAFRGVKHGLSQLEGTEAQEVVFEFGSLRHTKLMTSVIVYHGFAVDGLEFVYEDCTTQLFGKRGGSPDEFPLDVRRGEIVSGFNIRAGFWIDAIQVLTSMGRKSEMFGNTKAGSLGAIMPPRGYNIAGISGSCGQWMDGFALIITR